MHEGKLKLDAARAAHDLHHAGKTMQGLLKKVERPVVVPMR
jgi:hypothetical protein